MWKRSLCYLLLFAAILTGCGANVAIERSNLTDTEIPESVDRLIVRIMPERKEVSGVSITYTKESDAPLRADTSISICYVVQANVGGAIQEYKGTADLMDGNWVVGVPEPGLNMFGCAQGGEE